MVWLRAILLGVVLLTLPLGWVETTASCGPPSAPVVRTGGEVFAGADGAGLALIGLFALYVAVASRLVRDARRWLRMLVHGVTLIAAGPLTWFVALLTTGLLAKSRLLPGGFAAIFCLLCACGDAALRVLSDAADALRERFSKRGESDAGL